MIDKHGHAMITAVLDMLNSLPDDLESRLLIDVRLHDRDEDIVVTFTDEYGGGWGYEVESR